MIVRFLPSFLGLKQNSDGAPGKIEQQKLDYILTGELGELKLNDQELKVLGRKYDFLRTSIGSLTDLFRSVISGNDNDEISVLNVAQMTANFRFSIIEKSFDCTPNTTSIPETKHGYGGVIENEFNYTLKPSYEDMPESRTMPELLKSLGDILLRGKLVPTHIMDKVAIKKLNEDTQEVSDDLRRKEALEMFELTEKIRLKEMPLNDDMIGNVENDAEQTKERKALLLRVGNVIRRKIEIERAKSIVTLVPKPKQTPILGAPEAFIDPGILGYEKANAIVEFAMLRAFDYDKDVFEPSFKFIANGIEPP